MSHGGPTHRAAVLGLLRQAAGENVARDALVRAMYPDGGDRSVNAPHVLGSIIRRLCNDGHDIRGNKRDGYRMEPEDAPLMKQALRKCLGGCRKPFLSDGPHNRVCCACAGRDTGLDTFTVARL